MTVTERLVPMRRSARSDARDMNLPAGMTCADCFHCKRCCAIFGHIPEDEVCDWSPSRFIYRRRMTAGDLGLEEAPS